MSEGTCPTVRIDTPQGPTDINESDYDPKVHKLHGAKPTAKVRADETTGSPRADKSKAD